MARSCNVRAVICTTGLAHRPCHPCRHPCPSTSMSISHPRRPAPSAFQHLPPARAAPSWPPAFDGRPATRAARYRLTTEGREARSLRDITRGLHQLAVRKVDGLDDDKVVPSTVRRVPPDDHFPPVPAPCSPPRSAPMPSPHHARGYFPLEYPMALQSLGEHCSLCEQGLDGATLVYALRAP